MIEVTDTVRIPLAEITLTFIASPGPGGQNVNKVATAALLRFNIVNSRSLPEAVRVRLIAQVGNRLTTQGDLIIKGSRYRTQERNKEDVLNRLREILLRAAIPPKKRKKTKPTKSSKEKRLSNKKLQGEKKTLRQKNIRKQSFE